MKNGVYDANQNGGDIKRQRIEVSDEMLIEEIEEEEIASKPSLFLQILQTAKEGFSWAFDIYTAPKPSKPLKRNIEQTSDEDIQESSKKIGRSSEELIAEMQTLFSAGLELVPLSSPAQAIFSLPIDLLAKIMEHATPQGSSFPVNTSAVCRRFQEATDRLRIIHYNTKSTQIPLNPAVERQEKEINYLLKNVRAILNKTNHSVEVVDCLNRLNSAVRKPVNTRSFLVREEILNRLNTVIIKARISEISTTLDCRDCYLTRFPGKVITQHLDYFKALQTLYLNDNQLKSLPSEIGQLAALQGLVLGSNQFQTLPPEIGQLTALQRLYLNDNQLKSLPHEIGQLAVLQGLNLDSNQLQTLPPEIGRLAALQELYLDHNQLQTLPSEMGQLVVLQWLDLSNNQLQNLLPEIGQLIALRDFHLTGNQLKNLPNTIGQLIVLQGLHLTGNQLQSLPREIGQLVALKWLHLNGNQLESLPPEIG